MPWRKKQAQSWSPYWSTAIGALLAVLLGVLIGYTRWGTTASVVEIVERGLTKTLTRIEVLEQRLGAVEGKLGSAKNDELPAPANASAAPGKGQPAALQSRAATTVAPR